MKRSSEIKIKRHELMSVTSVAAMLRKMADQLETEHHIRLDEYPITMANYVHAYQKFEKKGRENLFKLTFTWEEELADQKELDDETQTRRNVDLPEDEELPRTPLDLPGNEGEQPRMRDLPRT